MGNSSSSNQKTIASAPSPGIEDLEHLFVSRGPITQEEMLMTQLVIKPIESEVVDNYEIEFDLEMSCSRLLLTPENLSVFKNFYHDYEGDGNLKSLIASLIGICVYRSFMANPSSETNVYNFHRSESVKTVVHMLLKSGGYSIPRGATQSGSFKWMTYQGNVSIAYRLYIKSTRTNGIPLVELIKRTPRDLVRNLQLSLRDTPEGVIYTCSPLSFAVEHPPSNPSFNKITCGDEPNCRSIESSP